MKPEIRRFIEVQYSIIIITSATSFARFFDLHEFCDKTMLIADSFSLSHRIAAPLLIESSVLTSPLF